MRRHFQCTRRLVDTLSMAFGDKFQYEGNRAIVFLESKMPAVEIKGLHPGLLTYHQVNTGRCWAFDGRPVHGGPDCFIL